MAKIILMFLLMCAFFIISSVNAEVSKPMPNVRESKKQVLKQPQSASIAPLKKNQNAVTSEKPNVVQKFQAMSLKGELKRPHLNFEKDSVEIEEDINLLVPENFNHEIIQDADTL